MTAALPPRWLLVGTVAVSLACSGPSKLEPPEILYGEDLCARCGMIVSEERFAAAALVRDDVGLVPRLYDDIGCMIAAELGPTAKRWVHEFRTLAWIDAEQASYARPEGLVTPMLSGLAAFSSAEAAAAAAGGESATIQDLQALVEPID